MPSASKSELIQELGSVIPLIIQPSNELYIQMACSSIEFELGLDNRDMLTIVNAERKKNGSGLGAGRRELKDLKNEDESRPNLELDSKERRIEGDFLALLTEAEGDFIPWAKDELVPEVFIHEGLRRLFEQLCAGEIPVSALGQIPELSASFIRLEDLSGKRVRAAMLADLAFALKKRYLKRRMEELKALQSEAEKAGDTDKVLELAQQMVFFKKQFSQEVEPK